MARLYRESGHFKTGLNQVLVDTIDVIDSSIVICDVSTENKYVLEINKKIAEEILSHISPESGYVYLDGDSFIGGEPSHEYRREEYNFVVSQISSVTHYNDKSGEVFSCNFMLVFLVTHDYEDSSGFDHCLDCFFTKQGVLELERKLKSFLE